jgi:AAA15 family ATPase/GTPase
VKTPWQINKIPIYLASDGLNKLTTLLLHVAHSTGTAIFVDEVENGFHHSRHSKIWRQLLAFSESYETQIFMATHSWEFLEAGAQFIEENSEKFSVIQVYQENGISKALVIAGQNAGAAIASDLDIRLGTTPKSS